TNTGRCGHDHLHGPDSPTQGTWPNPPSHRLRAALRRPPYRPRDQRVALRGMDPRGLIMNATTYRWLLASHIETDQGLPAAAGNRTGEDRLGRGGRRQQAPD